MSKDPESVSLMKKSFSQLKTWQDDGFGCTVSDRNTPILCRIRRFDTRIIDVYSGNEAGAASF
jgi:hypothetical protein